MKKFITLTLLMLIAVYGWGKMTLKSFHYSTENGLNHTWIRSMTQDADGYIWMGAADGLVRFDGFTFREMALGEGQRFLQDARVLGLESKDNGRFIIVSQSGGHNSVYDTRQDKFVNKTFKNTTKRTNSTAETKNLKRLASKYGAMTVTDNVGNHILFTLDGRIWIVRKGSSHAQRLQDIFSRELLAANNEPRYRFATSGNGILWISTNGNGLFSFDMKTGEQLHYLSTDRQPVIKSDNLLTVMTDKANNVWVSYEDGGVSCISSSTLSGATYADLTNGNDKQWQHIRMLTRQGGKLYIANKYGNLLATDIHFDNHYLLSEDTDDGVTAIAQDKEGDIWKGTRSTGVYYHQTNYRHTEGDKTSLSAGKISHILCDSKGRIWISVFDGTLDLAIPTRNGNMNFRHFFPSKDASLQPRWLMEDHHHRLWLCTSRGAYFFKPEQLIRNDKDFTRLCTNGKQIDTDETHCIYEDSRHHVWIGTICGGVSVWDNASPNHLTLIKRFTTRNGLPNNNVQSIVEDKEGNIWLGTDNGLVKYDIQQGTMRNYFPSANPKGNMFYENSAVCLDDGRLAFGTKDGLLTINPAEMKVQNSHFPLIMTNIMVNGNAIGELDENESPLLCSIAQADNLKFEHSQNYITFHFSDFEFGGDGKSMFTYILDGYDHEWSPLSALNFATYKNLPSGDYTLHVKAQNANGIQNASEIAFHFRIMPPWWATWWAYLLYILAILAIICHFYRQFIRETDLRNNIKVEEELTELKMRFFTNVSHEFRTPLTIIQGSMQHIGDMEIPAAMRQPISAMKKSTERMIRLVGQLMDFQKAHEEHLQLAVEETDVVAFVRDIFYTFRDLADNKHIRYNFITKYRQFTKLIDRNFIDKIAYNLISNALKYTPNGGCVDVILNADDHYWELRIADTGIGINDDKQKQMFTRFDQSTFCHDSIGIGLHLTNELVKAHHGTIDYRTNQPQGSVFTVRIPYDENNYADDVRMAKDNALARDNNEAALKSSITNSYQELSPEPLNHRHIMVVDDDDDMLEFVKTELSRYFIVDTAHDGKEAIEKMESYLPELVITDAIMPRMNGFQLVKQMRATHRLATIPIIMLTAINEEKQKIRGINYGADVYIEKPFSTDLLVAQCIRLLEQHNRLTTSPNATDKTTSKELPKIVKSEKDKHFREVLDHWLYANLSNQELNIDLLAEKMSYGRSAFYRKVKALTGKTPNEYIQDIKLEKALELLQDDTLTIQQVANAIGIKDTNYFSRLFKQRYGIPPSGWRKGG